MEDSRLSSAKLEVDMSQQWRPDVWLAKQMGMPVLHWSPAQNQPLPPTLPADALKAFVYARIPVKHINTVAALTTQGFMLVDTTVTLEQHLTPPPLSTTSPFQLRHALPEDKTAVTKLARHAYSLTRFHQDPSIPQALADEIQASWAANFFGGGRGDVMLVAHSGPEIIGFLLALAPTPGTMVIDLIAVAQGWQGKGVGKALVHTAQCHSQTTLTLTRTGTQLANAASLAFYQQLGFVVCHAAHVLHRHPHP